MKLNSIFSGLLEMYIGEKRKTYAAGYFRIVASALASFDAFCVEAGHASGELTEHIVKGWLSAQSHKQGSTQKIYRTAIRQFAIFLLEKGGAAYVPPVRSPGVPPAKAAIFSSSLGYHIEGLVESKRSRGYKYGSLNEYGILKRLDAFCISEGHKGDDLPRWLVEKWSERTGREGAKSRSNRIVVIRQLAMHIIAQGGIAYVAEAASVPRSPFPYVPNESEMAALLTEIDAQNHETPWSRLTLPILFRLLLTSGLRISEACSLEAGCIDLRPEGYCSIDIINAKGHRDRRIFLSGEILTLLRAYDEKMSAMLPERKWFFPGDYRPLEEHVSHSSARKRFGLARDVVYSGNPGRRPTVHSLRHAYIIWTIRRWREDGLCVDEMLPYLSKHLGHSSIQETFTYYDHYGRDFAHIRNDAGYFEAIVPEVRYEN